MKKLKILYAFLASVQFACLLLFSTAFAVAIATFIESAKKSHLAAVRSIYGHPFFQLLLLGFFLNILLSALKRYPFKKRHIPFLSTHLGLLLIILGIALKNFFGVQGHLVVREGQTTKTVLLPNTYAIKLEKRPEKLSDDIESTTLPLQEHISLSHENLFFQVKKIIPHTKTSFHSFLYPDRAKFFGVSEIPYSSLPATIHLGKPFGKAKIALLEDKKPLSSLLKESVFTLYSWGSENPIFKGTLEEVKEPFTVEEKDNALTFYKEKTPLVQLELAKDAPIISFIDPSLQDFCVDFSQKLALSYDKKAPILSFLSRSGSWTKKSFPLSFPKEIAIYERGFGGYTCFFPLPPPSCSFEEQKELEEIELLALFENYLQSSSSPAATFIKSWAKTCQIPPSLLASLFFAEWRRSHKLLLNTSSLSLLVSKQLAKKAPPIPDDLSYFALFALSLPKEVSSMQKWKETHPLTLQKLIPDSLNDSASFTKMLQKIRYALSKLPEPLFSYQYDPTTIFCIFLAEDGIYPQAFFPSEGSKKRQKALLEKSQEVFSSTRAQLVLFSKNLQEEIKKKHHLSDKRLNKLLLTSFFAPEQTVFTEKEHLIEAPLTRIFSALPLPQKEEEAKPVALISFQKDGQKELAAIPYDRQATGLPWPILEGSWRVNLQPKEVEMPFSLRLQNAQTIYLPGSLLPQKYLADVLIEEKGKEPSWEELSMNQVFERNGWRIYLSSLTPEEEGESKTVVFAVNYDPVKKFLTYPGAILVAFGVVTLFLFWPYRKDR